MSNLKEKLAQTIYLTKLFYDGLISFLDIFTIKR